MSVLMKLCITCMFTGSTSLIFTGVFRRDFLDPWYYEPVPLVFGTLTVISTLVGVIAAIAQIWSN